MENWCIIPARGGSKTIPRKNILNLAGYPLIAYTICAALKARSVTRVMVSTDDEEIAEVARRWGAEVPFLRPVELSRDDSPTLPAIWHAVDTLEQQSSVRPEFVTLLQPTSPFTRPDQIEEAMKRIAADQSADAITSVLEVDHVNHPYNVRVIREDGSVEFFMPEAHYKFPSRQSKPAFYRFGNLYVMRHDTLMVGKTLFGTRCLPLKVDLASCFDINDLTDLRIAEFMIRADAVTPSHWMPAHPAVD